MRRKAMPCSSGLGKLHYLDQQKGRYFLSYVIKDILGRNRQDDWNYDSVDLVGPKDETIVQDAADRPL